MRTRRELLKTAAAAIAAPVARAQHQHADGALVEIAKPYVPKVLNPEQMQWVSKLVDVILPRTDTPGASDAAVPAFIDRALSRDEEAKALFLQGMAQLDETAQQRHGSAFAVLNLERQTEMLKAMEADAASPSGKFFKQVKDLTIDGYYTSKPGLTVELDWHANTFLSEFKGCTHPEHQA
jgi:glucoside 3-dehydrogenase (cytochrome c) hitch-hiker subunit